MRLAAPDLIGQGNGKKRPAPPSKRETKEHRQRSTVNLTDARTDIEDEELFWLENAITLGKGSVQILQGPGAPIATLPQGIASTWGFVLNTVPVQIVVGLDGSLTQIPTPGGVQTVISGAGAVSTAAHLAIFRDTTVLIIDPTLGYS